MEEPKVKCPHCGAQKVDHLGLNQYQCQYCGHTFSVGREIEFSEESRKEFEFNQNEERKNERKKVYFKGARNFALLLLGAFVVAEIHSYYNKHVADQQYHYSSEGHMIPIMENGSFSNDNETVEFFDYARKVKINDNVLDCAVFGKKYETLVVINSVKYELCYDADSTYEFLRHEESKEMWVKRPTRSEKPHEIFLFKSEDQLREYLLKAPFKFHEETIRFTDHGYNVVINGKKYEIYETYIDTHVSDAYGGIDRKAVINFDDKKSLSIYSDEQGDNMYIMYKEKKYTR